MASSDRRPEAPLKVGERVGVLYLGRRGTRAGVRGDLQGDRDPGTPVAV
jgi:hypothetical protein